MNKKIKQIESKIEQNQMTLLDKNEEIKKQLTNQFDRIEQLFQSLN